jgi:hypothetical protein
VIVRRVGQVPERVVARTATGITRRRLLRRAGGVALGAALAAAYLDKVATDPAFAVTCFGHGDIHCGLACKTEPCGPSPKCGDNHCHANGQCMQNDVGGSHTKGRTYEGGECTALPDVDYRGNCWCNCSGGKMRRCCDCCQENDTGADKFCWNCPWQNPWYKCHCHQDICENPGCC